MTLRDFVTRNWPATLPLQPVPRRPWTEQLPTYKPADPALIGAALRRSQHRPSGNWYVMAPSRDIGGGDPFGVTIGGIELVAWRDSDGHLHVGPGACPHLGAPLSTAVIDCDGLRCRWHGLLLEPHGQPGWSPFPCYDDGVLAWVRLDRLGGETPLDRPVISARPPHPQLSAVATLIGICEPVDIIANRLDPWHGAWFHPYSFTHLDVISTPEVDDDRFVVTVTFRVAGSLGAPSTAEFTSPEPRTILMRIIEGEGVGSVVETHATPIGPGPDGKPRTAVIEAVVAHSPRPGFRVASRAAPALRPLMRRAAARLWRDDLAYAERRYHRRSGLSGGVGRQT